MSTNPLTLTVTALQSPKDLKGMFELEAFKANYAKNYNITSGSSRGELIFERERVLFMKALAANAELEACERFSIYAAFIELAASGSTLAEGCAYIIPYKGKANFQMGYKGRLEIMNTIPGIDLVPEPQVVYTGDDFDFELGEEPKIIRHKPKKERAPEAVIEFVYLVVTHNGKNRLTILDREKVLSVRDRYSIPFKYWKSKGGEMTGDKVTKKTDAKEPLWCTDPARCFKKTCVNQAYSFLPKTERMKALDRRIKYNLDPETGVVIEDKEIDYGITGQGPTIDTKHEEVKPAAITQGEQQPAAQETPAPTEKPDLGNLSDAF